jgi:hydrogenase maturation protease
MGDDGVGVQVAEELISRDLGVGVDVVNGATDGMALTRHFMDAETVILVDAVAVADTPGSVYRFTPDDAGITSLRPHSSHGISVPSIMLAARLQGACPQVIVYGVQVGDIMCGFETLSPEVGACVGEIADMVAEEAMRIAASADARGDASG